MKKTTTIALSMLIATGAHAAPKNQVAAGSIVCFTEDGYSAQMKALAQGVEKTIKECGVAGKAIPVIVIESNMFSASQVRAVDGGMTLWVGMESIEGRK
jgi:hypothetical protein